MAVPPDVRAADGIDIRVTLLGSGGGPAGGSRDGLLERMNAMTLIEAGGRVLLVDAGRGVVQRLAALGRPYFRRVDNLFLTHLHSDHVTGIPDLFLTGAVLGRQAPLRVWGPSGTADLVDHLVKAFAYDLEYRENRRRKRARMIAREIGGGVIELGDGLVLTAFAVDHSPPSPGGRASGNYPALGYRLDFAGRSVVLSGDTRPSENLVTHAAGADLLIHEVQLARPGRRGGAAAGRPAGRSHHTTAREAGAIFARIAPKLAVYSHLIMGRATPEELIRRTRQTYAGRLAVGRDLMVIEIGEKIRILE
jgi:ribonuclease Z